MFKHEIEEIDIGVDNIFFFYIRRIKINVGITLLFMMGLKYKQSENEEIREKEHGRFNLLSISVKVFMFTALLVFKTLGLSAIFYYLYFFSFVSDFQELKIGIPHLNGFYLAMGFIELSVIADIISEFYCWAAIPKNYFLAFQIFTLDLR